MVKIYQIHENDVSGWWPQIEPLLDRIFDRMPRTESNTAIFRKLVFREAICWAISLDEAVPTIDAIVIVLVTRDGWLRIDYCAGEEIERWFEPMLAEVHRHAERMKCRGVTVVGRKGWGRMLAEHGYAEGLHLFVKVLEDEA